MSAKAVFSIELDSEPDAVFTAVSADDHPVTEALHEWVDDDFDWKTEERLTREYPRPSPEEYLEFMRRKVEAARADVAAGRGRPHAEVEADFAARHARVMAGRT